eukprot:CAMPEP_0183465228 /NCGR_PEP_ID=MMETSP0370-20130417/146936_1 /TAXON_ID=268820 /ORGANISM="Peridinium aciculiferum, Strain PAER-2" /LENGTH=42 /DNA_ID= /DNA_START= /DNA_END= /DNA_ORIENTATION=
MTPAIRLAKISRPTQPSTTAPMDGNSRTRPGLMPMDQNTPTR